MEYPQRGTYINIRLFSADKRLASQAAELSSLNVRLRADIKYTEATLESYLQIAKVVLRSTRRPMSARAILEVAYQAGVVPAHLYGKTQHKTLQARLSEDILHRRETSAFYRTEPGQFFLIELLGDPEIPDEWKKPFPARRRTRDLKRDNTLAIKKSFIKERGPH